MTTDTYKTLELDVVETITLETALQMAAEKYEDLIKNGSGLVDWSRDLMRVNALLEKIGQ